MFAVSIFWLSNSRPVSEFRWVGESCLRFGEQGYGLVRVAGFPEPRWTCLWSEILAYPLGSGLAVITIWTCYLHVSRTCLPLPGMVRNDIPSGLQVSVAICSLRFGQWPPFL